MNEKVKERIDEFRKTFRTAKEMIEGSFDKSENVIQAAIDSNRDAAETRTIVDTSTEWMILVKNDAFEKGRKQGYSSASEHMLPVLTQKKAMLSQLDELVNKTLDALANELSVAIEAIQKLTDERDVMQNHLNDTKSIMQQKSSEITALKSDLEKLKRENEALQKKVEEKPKRGRPRKKKEEGPLD